MILSFENTQNLYISDIYLYNKDMKEFKLREKRQQKEVKFHIESSVIKGDFEFHGHDFCELAFIASGQGWHTIGDRQYQLKKGDIYIVKGKEKHGFAALENVRIFNIMLNVYDLVEEDCGALPGFWVLFVHEQFDDFLSHMHVTGEDYNRVLGWCELLLQEYQAKEPGYVTVCHSVLMQMIVFLSRKFQIRQREEMTVDYRLAKAVVHMQTNFADRITIDQLADMTGFSGRHFTRLFQQVYGLPPIQFLNELRLKHAKMLLESGNYKVTEVASLCGFQDSNYFSAYFKEKNGCPPSEWRG